MKLKTKFQDEDFDLGEVVEAAVSYGGANELKVEARAAKGGHYAFYFGSLKELTDMFEDYEEPKEYWYIDSLGEVYMRTKDNQMSDIENTAISDWHLQIGNYFETKEEAEKAVERLRAWERLKDKGFRFDGYNACSVDYDIDEQYRRYISEDLGICFGGEK